MKKKILVACLCVALAVLTVAGTTLAYLTSRDEVKNTFTVGNVTMTLDEAKVDTNGDAITGEGADRVKTNDYMLYPGHEYDKDPTVHVAAGSSHSWIFIKVKNNLAPLESRAADYKSINTQIADNNWTVYADANETGYTVYYKEHNTTEAKDYVVFDGFTLDDNANNVLKADGSVTVWSTINPQAELVTVTAYAIQYDGFETVAKAWDHAKTLG